MAEADLVHLQDQASSLRESLSKFAAKYRKQINADPEFRRYFTVACQAAGVDPLASNKAALGKLLGMGDFYFALGVQVVDVAMAARATQGVLLPMQLCLKRLATLRGSHASEISAHDVRAALKALEPLGQGVSLAVVSGQEYIVTLPQELSSDTTAALDAAARTLLPASSAQPAPSQQQGLSPLSSTAHLSPAQLAASLQWALPRASDALNSLLKDGAAWLDAPAGCPPQFHVYFFPGLTAPPDGAQTPPSTDTAAADTPKMGLPADAKMPALPPSPPADDSSPQPAAESFSSTPPSSTPAGGGDGGKSPSAHLSTPAAALPARPAQTADVMASSSSERQAPAAASAPGGPRGGAGGLARLMAMSGSADIAALKLGARGRRR